MNDIFPESLGGRPPIYETVEELQAKISEYFAGGYHKRPMVTPKGEDILVPKITITDLVLFLGFADRHSFYDYEKKEEFSHTIKRARSFIEREYEEQLAINPTGAIFALKNFGWTDKQELEHSGEIKGGSDDLKTIAAGISKLLTDEPTTSETSSQGNS